MFNGFALNNIKNAYVGSTPAQAIYLGSTLIWPTTPSEHDYSKDYFTIVSLEDNNDIYFKINVDHNVRLTISVSTDDGLTWTEKTPSYTSSGYNVKLATLNTNDKILIKGNNLTYSPYTSEGYPVHYFECSKKYNVEGNILSLSFGDNFISSNPTTLSFQAFQYLLCKLSAPKSDDTTFGANTNLISAENLILPNVVGDACYSNMFQNCIALTIAPVLPATTLKTTCYAAMFRGCSSLRYIKCLATDISADSCTLGWCGDTTYHQFSSSGTFVKDGSMTSWTTGLDGIHEGWTVQNA